MSNLFETDIGSLFPAALPQSMSADTNARVTALEENQLRLLTLIEQMVAGDKVRAQAFDLLREQVSRLDSRLERKTS
jgi:hypothetical protein